MTAARRFDDLRPKPPADPAQRPDGIERALQRIMLTEDGRHLEAWLKAEMRKPSHPAATNEILREAEGARRAYEHLLDMGEVNIPVR